MTVLQVRGINLKNVASLMRDLTENPPKIIRLVVNKDRGVFARCLHLLHCVICCMISAVCVITRNGKQFGFWNAVVSNKLPCFVTVTTGSGIHYIVDGQHIYTAAQAIKQKAMENAEPPPAYADRFLCTILKEMSAAEAQEVAGRFQRLSQSVIALKFSEAMRLFLNQYRQSPQTNITELLKKAYHLSGQSSSHEGGVVCATACALSVWLPLWSSAVFQCLFQ